MPGAARADAAAGVIGLYQRHISPLRQARCPFSPSCSQYALEAVRERGPLGGAALAADRLVRCNPAARRFHARGPDGHLLDPVGTEPPPRTVPRLPAWIVSPPGDTLALAGLPERAAEFASFARALAAEGDCERAATEYRRAAHAAGNPGLGAWARLRSGICAYDNEAWGEAAAEFVQAAALATSEPERTRARLLAAASRFDAGRFADCDTLLAACAEDSTTISQLLALRGASDLVRGQWDDARARFAAARSTVRGGFHPAKLDFLAARAADGRALPHRSPAFAVMLSALVPGAGQIYAGRLQDGLRHLVFNGALLWTIVELARDDHWPAAYLVAGVELPFYVGNLRGARSSARVFDRDHRLRFAAALLAQTDR